MKFVLRSLVMVLLFFSCRGKGGQVVKSNSVVNIEGNWSSYSDREYKEFYISKEKIYLFNTGMGNLYEYKYFVKKDSLFVSKKDYYSDYKEFRFGDLILAKDSLQIVFDEGIFESVQDSFNLGSYINGQIELREYESWMRRRKELKVPLDSLKKWAGEPIDLN